MSNKYNWGIYNGIHGIPWDRQEKSRNVRNQVQYMLNRSLLMFEYNNLPESLPALELEKLLQTNGFAGITEVEGKIYAFYGGLGGEQDVYGRPTTMVISNPALKYNATLEIGKDVVLMRNDTMMLGLVPTFSKYSSIMNENEITMVLASISKRVNNLISVSDDATAESAKTYLKKLEEGDLGYIFESKLFDSLQTNALNSGGNASMSDLIELQQYLKASMYNEIGLNANFNMKRERLNTSEVEMNSDNLYPLVDNMLENRRIALDEINEKYGTDIEVSFNSSWNYRVNQGENVTDEDLEKFDEQQQDDDGFSSLDENFDTDPSNSDTGSNSSNTVENTTQDTTDDSETSGELETSDRDTQPKHITIKGAPSSEDLGEVGEVLAGEED